MNLGISNTQVSTWKRIKTQHIVAAAGVALAVSALVGGLAIRDSGSSSSSFRAAGQASVSQPAPQPQTFVYVVGSQAEAGELQNAFSGAELESGVDIYRIVIVVDSAEVEAGLQIMQGELVQAGGSNFVSMVDLRAAAPATDVAGLTISEPAPGAYPLVQELSHPQ